MRPSSFSLLIACASLVACDELPEMAFKPTPPVAPWSKSFGDAEEQLVSVLNTDRDGNLAIAGQYSGTVDFGGGYLPGTPAGTVFWYVAAFDARGKYRFATALTGSGSLFPRGLAPTLDGGWIFSAVFSGTVVVGGDAFDGLSNDVLLVSFDRDGDIRWIKHFSSDDGGPAGAGSGDPMGGLALAPNGDVIMAGNFSGTFGFGGKPIDAGPPVNGVPVTAAFLVAFDDHGKQRWARRYGDDVALRFDPVSIAVEPDGDIVLGGDRQTFDGQNGFLARFDENGALLGETSFGGSAVSAVGGVTFDPDGNLIFGGWFAGQVSIGSFSRFSPVRQGLVGSISPRGQVSWVRTLGGMYNGDDAAVYGVVADSHGVVASSTYVGSIRDLPRRSTPAGRLVEFDLDGNFQDTKTYSLTKADSGDAPHLALVHHDLIMAGTFVGDFSLRQARMTSVGGSDVFLYRGKR